MKPARFNYFKPETLQEAFMLLDEYGYDAKLLAGGQSLIPMMNMRLARPQVVIDINGLKELSYIRDDGDSLRIGALTRHFMVEQSPLVAENCPLLYEGIQWIGHSQIRSRGTIGGSIVHADPTAELPVILSVLGGSVTVASRDEERTLSPDEFFLTYMTTTIEPTEVLISAEFPKSSGIAGHAVEEFALRKGDFAIVLAVAVATLNPDGTIQTLGLSLGGVDGAPVRLDEITDSLIGRYPDDALIKQCCSQIWERVEPEGDIHASADYRRDLSVTLSARALSTAVKRAQCQM
ncbi:FAD binding domain-containing protein [Alicyclobacillus dauci]|uniref:Xanthine dehydrogenase family protein subunit M n=1 Tax=Alicyclobacillus dauci TaxID=1475485 RepID=A0ABY6YZR7_9BACL|nr:xanthine dehydrogenase family protein subunit M [Alicyclobacillus dauci]WAH35210.1 xanthine dehydrogenase family protein subunit M [Alicyclobacillus dauci]